MVVSFSAIADTNLSHFTFSGTTRFRYENLNDQFRKNLTGSDKVLAIRNLVAGSWRITFNFLINIAEKYPK